MVVIPKVNLTKPTKVVKPTMKLVTLSKFMANTSLATAITVTTKTPHLEA